MYAIQNLFLVLVQIFNCHTGMGKPWLPEDNAIRNDSFH